MYDWIYIGRKVTTAQRASHRGKWAPKKRSGLSRRVRLATHVPPLLKHQNALNICSIRLLESKLCI